MVPLPNLMAKLVDVGTGLIVRPWNSFLQQFVQAPPDFQSVNVTTSPFNYIAREPGTLFISEGTITAINVVRGTQTIVMGNTPKIIPLAIRDTAVIAYSVIPQIWFAPAYGQNTTS